MGGDQFRDTGALCSSSTKFNKTRHVPQAFDIPPQRSRPTTSGFKVQASTTSSSSTCSLATAPIDHRHRKLIPSSRSNRATSFQLVFSHNLCTVITTLVRGLLRPSALGLRSIPTPVKYNLRTALTMTMMMMTPLPYGVDVLIPQTPPCLNSRPASLSA